MANVGFAGLGGGGIRVTLEVINWLRTQIKSDYQGLGESHPEWCWLYGEYDEERNELKRGFGVVFLDARSDEFQRLGEEFEGRRYLTSEKGGYGGDWKAQYEDLEKFSGKTERERVTRTEPAEVPPLNWLSGKGFEACHKFIPVFSMDGGSGRGCFEFLIEHKEEFLNPDIEIVGPLAIYPQVAQLRDRMRRENVNSGVDSFKEKLRKGLVDYILCVDNDIATFKAARWQGIMEERTAEKMYKEIGEFVEHKKYRELAGAIDGYARSYSKVGMEEMNASITIVFAPFLMAALGALLRSEVKWTYPMDFDYRDFRSFMKGHVVVPAYSHTTFTMEELERRYRSLGYKKEHPLGLELDATIANDSLAPVPYSLDGVKEVVDGIYVFVWGRKKLEKSDHDNMVGYIADTLGGDIQVIFMSGEDPLSGHSLAGYAEMRIWVYLRLRDPELLRAKVNGMEGE